MESMAVNLRGGKVDEGGRDEGEGMEGSEASVPTS